MSLSNCLFTLFLCSLFIPYIVCKIKGIDTGHPGSVVGELNVDIAAIYRASKHD